MKEKDMKRRKAEKQAELSGKKGQNANAKQKE